MPYLTTSDSGCIRKLIRNHEWIHLEGKWNSHGWEYFLKFGIKMDQTGEYHSGWHVEAGCRTWSSFAQMRKHYKDPDWREGLWPPRTQALYRKQSLDIATAMKRFCNTYGIKLAGERKETARKTVRRQSRKKRTNERRRRSGNNGR